MKIIKKEIELIEFEDINGFIQQAYKIIDLRLSIGFYQIIYIDIYKKLYKSNITEQTYNKLLEHLGWGKEIDYQEKNWEISNWTCGCIVAMYDQDNDDDWVFIYHCVDGLNTTTTRVKKIGVAHND